ncbi:ABC transporter ATP-binding protein [Anaerolentibacter hominis]|uniref:ABC transporter ATP-binding protein n=1 Tax=Anaerolentibacter hominis TaxID=3079009 RepID=UPI0031B89996
MPEAVITISNLTKQYNAARVKAVDGISFEVNRGELFAFLGVNGAGKSTTINILCTLLGKTGGEVSVCGFDIERQPDEVKNNIGVVFQTGVLDDKLSVSDNLMFRGALFGLDKKTLAKRINNLAVRLGMTEFLKRPYGKLSGGQKRKCDIARALISNPKILFLDEPTTGLDPQSRVDLWQVIRDIRDEFHTTIFLTTHYMEEVNSADRIAIIDKGRLLCLDTPEGLKSNYSYDTVKLTVKNNNTEKIENILKEHKLEYQFSVDTFTLKVKSGLERIEMLAGLKALLSSVEIIKGDMDSVFLNVVGGRTENGEISKSDKKK